MSVALGIFSGRWILAALGEVDFGLLGVIGGMIAFVTFFNAALAEATGRFYAFSIGKSSLNEHNDQGLEDCRKWFNTALFLHIVIPALLVMIGWPAGEWMVEHFLNIPADRVSACVWVWRFSCVTCFISMVNVPFRAMYVAKQYIAELTVYDLSRTLVNFFFIYYMMIHPSDWLVKYAGWTCLIVFIPQLLICIRAQAVFPECRIRPTYFWSPQRMKELGSFAGWHTFGSLAYILRSQGNSIIVNKFFGAGINASFSLASTVDGQVGALSGAMRGAFQPAIAQAYGANDLLLSRMLSAVTSKFCLSATLFFALPFFLEGGYIMKLWLVHPPLSVTEICVLLVIGDLIDKSTLGHILAINATGNVALSQSWEAVGRLICIPVSIILCFLGCGPCSIGWAYIVSSLVISMGRVYCAQKNIGLSIMYWVKKVAFPAVCLTLSSMFCGTLIKNLLGESLLRLLCITICVELLFMFGMWFLMLDRRERKYILKHLRTHLSARLK